MGKVSNNGNSKPKTLLIAKFCCAEMSEATVAPLPEVEVAIVRDWKPDLTKCILVFLILGGWTIGHC
jgi:hypothetical protein